MKTQILFPVALLMALHVCLSALGQQAGTGQEPTTSASGGTAAEVTDVPPRTPIAIPVDFENYRRHRQEHPAFFTDYVLDTEATNFGDAVTFKGSSTVNGILTGSSLTIFGDARV